MALAIDALQAGWDTGRFSGLTSVRERLAVVPTLDEIADDPSKAHGLPAATRQRLLARWYLVGGVLVATPETPAAPQYESDRVLGIEEAAAMLGMTTDFLYRQWGKLALGYKDADGRVKFRFSKVQRYIKGRAGR